MDVIQYSIADTTFDLSRFEKMLRNRTLPTLTRFDDETRQELNSSETHANITEDFEQQRELTEQVGSRFNDVP